MAHYLCTIFISLASLFTLSNAAATFNVMSFGAKQDGKRDSTQPFLMAWSSACSSTQPTTVYVPRGSYMIKDAIFRGPCRNKIMVQIDGTLVTPDDFRDIGDSDKWLLFLHVNLLSIIGGTLDAKGPAFWDCCKRGKNCSVGARVRT